MPRHPSLVIGLDVDGVVADLIQPLLDAVHQRSGQRILQSDISAFDLATVLEPDLWAIARQELCRPGFAASLPPFPDAFVGVERLRRSGRVVFVTTPFGGNDTWCAERSAWLLHHFHADPADVAHLVDKTLFRGDLLIDDAPHHLAAWVALGRPAIRVDRPWNQGAPGRVAHNWADIVRLVEQLASERHDSPV